MERALTTLRSEGLTFSIHWNPFQLNPDMRALYARSNHTLIDWDQRKRLRGKDLARWLQLYFASHADPFPVKVETLRGLSGSKAGALKKFREGLRRGLQDLVDNGDLVAWEIDPTNDLVTVDRGAGLSDSQRKHLSKRKNRSVHTRRITGG